MAPSAPVRPSSPALPVGRIAEPVGLALWLVAAGAWVAWVWNGGWNFGPTHLAMAAGLVLALAILARRGWVRVFGPVLFYEGLRAARRPRFFFLRWLYACGLLLLLLWVHTVWAMEHGGTYGGSAEQPFKRQAKLAQDFFYAFAAVQFAAVVLLTPAYVAGGVAEEKEKRTLEFLLATDLRGREIVFGKLLARLGNLALFIMTGLPVLSLMQFFGGIDPGMLLASFAVTALTAGSLAGLGILLSVQRRRARDAIILTYLIALAYVAVASLLLAVPPLWAAYHSELAKTAVANNPRLPLATAPYYEEIDTAVNWFNAGNPFHGLGQIVMAVGTGGSVADVVGSVVERYAVFHGLFMLVTVGLAVVRLRPVALAQAGTAARRKRRRFQLVRFRRPPVGRLPMVWKEVRVEGGLKFGWFGRILVALVVGISFVPFVIIVWILFLDPNTAPVNYPQAWDHLGDSVNVWVRSVNTAVSTLMLLGVAVRAAGSFGSERDRDTLTSLMTTTLTTGEIVWGKLFGSLTSVRMFVVWLGVVWAIGLVTGGVSPLAVPLEIAAWAIPAAFLAAFGLYCSAVFKTTLRAITWTVAGTLFAIGVHWVCVGMCCFMPLSAAGVHERSMTWLLELEAGLSPPFLFAWLPFQGKEHWPTTDPEFPLMIFLAQVFWLVGALVVGHLAHEKFRQLTNRATMIHNRPRPSRPLPPRVVPVED
jgi:ABC-type transport system involved in multi-copper enzyme maturation permease subunit